MKYINLIVIFFFVLLSNLFPVYRYVLNGNSDTQYNVWMEIDGVDICFEQVNPGIDAGAGTSPLSPWSTLDYALSNYLLNDTIIYFRYNGEDTKNINHTRHDTVYIYSNFGRITTLQTNTTRTWRLFGQIIQGFILDKMLNYENSSAGGYNIIRGYSIKYMYIKDCRDINTNGNAGGISIKNNVSNCYIYNLYIDGGWSERSGKFGLCDAKQVMNNVIDSVTVNNRGIVWNFFWFYDTPVIDRNIFMNINRLNPTNTPNFINTYSAQTTNLLYNNFNDNGYNAIKLTENPQLLNYNGVTYPFNENYPEEVGFDDTGLSFWLTYYPFENDNIIAYLLQSLKLRDNELRAKIINRMLKVRGADAVARILSDTLFSADAVARILSNTLFSADTVVRILSDTLFSADAVARILSDTSFSYDTQYQILANANFSDTQCNILLYQNANYRDSNYVIPRLLYHAPLTKQRFNGTDTENIDIEFRWDNIKGANATKIQIANDEVFSNILVDADLPMNSNKYNYRFNQSGTYYWRIKGLKK